jgi:putative adenylate-forming enzyme
MQFKLLILFYWLRIQWQNTRFKTRAALESYQRQKLREHWKWLQKHSPYYTVFGQTGTDWSQLPLMNKQMFMEHFDTINTCGIKKEEALALAMASEQQRDFSPTLNGITIGLSSGTSGNRGLFLASQQERAKWVAAILDRVIGFRLKKRKAAFFLRANSNLYTSVHSELLSFRFFDLLDEPSQHSEPLNRLQPDILIAQPSMLMLLAKAQEKGELTIRPTQVISVAEVLENGDKEYLTKVFKQPISQVYQCTEGFLGYCCREGRLHLNEDFVHIEKKYIDDENVRFHPIITDFTRKSQPIIRYELNDILWEDSSPCPCGSSMISLRCIEGRSDDSFQLQNKEGAWLTIFPDFIRRAMLIAGDDIPPYVIEQTEEAKVVVHLTCDELPASLTNRIYEALSAFFALKNLSPVQISIVKSSGHERGQKLRRILRTSLSQPN